MRLLISLSLLLCATAGCDATATKGKGSPGPVAPNTAAATPAEVAKAMLEERATLLDEQLAATEDDDERRALRRQHLVLTITIAELSRRIEADDASEVDVDRLLTSVELFLATQAPTRRPRPPKVAGGDTGAKQPRFKPVEPKEENEKEEDAADDTRSTRGFAKAEPGGGKSAKRKNKKGRKSDKDSLETALASGGPSGGEGKRVEKARVEVEQRPRGLMTAVQRRVSAMESCLGSIDDDVTLRVTVSLTASGNIRIAKVRGVASREATCISRILKSVRVPDHDGGTRIVRFPLYFQP